MEKYFNNENTEGFSESILEKMNEEMEKRIMGIDDPDHIKNIGDKIITEFDHEI